MPPARELAVVGSPLQLLNAGEASDALGPAKSSHLVLVEPTEPAARTQMDRVLGLRPWPSVERLPRQVFDSPVRKLIWLRQTLKDHNGVERLIIGQYRLSLTRHLAHRLAPQQTVVVDDGTGTLLLEAKRRATGSGADALVGVRQGVLRRKLHGLVGLERGEVARLTFFSIYPITGRPGDLVVRNTYAHLRQRLPEPGPAEGTVLLGSSIVETGIVSEPAYVALLASALRGQRDVRYLAHRREGAGKLARLERALPIRVEVPDLPVELLFFRKPPRLVLSPVSSALDVIGVLHGERITLRLLRIAAQDLAPRARADFLAQQDRLSAAGIPDA